MMNKKKRPRETDMERIRRLIQEAHEVTNGMPEEKPKKKDKDKSNG